MSIKKLFGIGFKDYKSASVDVESPTFINQEVKDRQVYLPPIDFASASNFVKYGQAELYYKNSISRIYNDYPYDGSKAEIIDFDLSSSYLDRWMLSDKYPKSTGYIELGRTSNYTGLIGSTGYGATGTPEYIRVWGGIHTASSGMDGKLLRNTFDKSGKYDLALNRTQNWRITPASGSTVEFWMKKPSFNASATEREVILDIWNGEAAGTADYARFLLEVDCTSVADCIELTYQSGSNGFYRQSICSTDVTLSSLKSWHHYAISVVSASAGGLDVRFYKDGAENRLRSSLGTATAPTEFNGLLNAYIGAIQSKPSSGFPTVAAGSGKFSGSLDEFRFWKTRRPSNKIELNWFNQVGGGANTDNSTTDLGVYFKFNEGIVGDTTTDGTTLDYSGRLANGFWRGYSTGARFTGSAFVESNLGITESANPIIYSSHPRVQSLITEMQISGSDYDSTSGRSFYYSLPAWITDEDAEHGENLRKVSQILSSYFDTLYSQISSLSDLQNKVYVQPEYKPMPFAIELLKSKGLISNDILINADILELFGNIDRNAVQYEDDISKIKNLIYLNIYNNLESIYKSKGTEKSIRNLIRCFGIDDEIVKMNIYTDGGVHYFTDKAKASSVQKKYINFNDPLYFSSTIYQTSSVSNPLTYISGTTSTSAYATSLLTASAFTMEADVYLPYKKNADEKGYFNTPFLSSSIFGFDEAVEGIPHDYTWEKDNEASLRVYLVKDKINSRNAKFAIKNYDGTIDLESEWFQNIYNNNHWNISIRAKLDQYPLIGTKDVTAKSGSIELYAVNTNFSDVENSVHLTASLTIESGSYYLHAPKRIYAGSHYTNFTGSIITKSDVKIGAVRAWLDYVSDDAIIEHNKDVFNYGNSKTTHPPNMLLVPNHIIPAQELTILNWDFDTVTGSDSSGNFIADDLTSGSTDTIYGWIDEIIRRENKAKAAQFGATATKFIENEFLYASKKELPEISYTNDNIFIKGKSEVYFSQDDDVSDNFYLIEKSMNQVISEQMIKLFSTVQEFSNLIGRPVDHYRMDYKKLNTVQRLFFEKVTADPDLDNFLNYYKWIDESISKMISQLIPAAVNFGPDIMDVVESHILERNKYQRRIGVLTTVESTEGAASGINKMLYNWRTGHAPVDGDPNKNCVWQKERNTRSDIPDREKIREVIYNEKDPATKQLTLVSREREGGVIKQTHYTDKQRTNRNLDKPYRFTISFGKLIHGGTNYTKGKNRDFIKTAVAVHGPKGPSGAPRNVLGVGIGLSDGIIETPRCDDVLNPSEKKYYSADVQVAKFAGASADLPLESNLSYLYKLNSNHVWPSNIKSGTLNSGYNKTVYAGFRKTAIITNLHSDTTDITNEIPMQGPFSHTFVGGNQSRHINLNRYNPSLATLNKIDDQYSRPEAWRLLIGENPLNPSPDGAMGYVGPDYGGPYPDTTRKWAIYYRDGRSKRPLNIKNIQTTTTSPVVGNYTNNYEVVSTVGASSQRYYLRKAINSPDEPGLITGEAYSDLPATTQYFGTFAQHAQTSIATTTIKFNQHFWTTTPAYNNSSWANDGATLTLQDTYGKTIVFVIRYQGAGLGLHNFSANGSAKLCAGGFTDLINQTVAAGGFGGTLTASWDGDVNVRLVQPIGAKGNTNVVYHANFPAFGAGTTEQFKGGGGPTDIGLSPSFGSLSLYQLPQIKGRPNPYPRTDLTGSRSIITSRFSAPGGPEINSRGFLNITSGEYSVYNNINFRNLSVRMSGSGEEKKIRVVAPNGGRDGLRTLLSRHCAKFGFAPGQAITYEDIDTQKPKASAYKQARNTSIQPRAEGSKLIKAIDCPSTGATHYMYLKAANAKGYSSPTDPLSFGFWLNCKYSGLGDNHAICTFLQGTTTDVFRIFINSADKLEVYVRSSLDGGATAKSWYSAANEIPSGIWTYVVVIWDGDFSSDIVIYINGSQHTLTDSSSVGAAVGVIPRDNFNHILLCDFSTASAAFELQGQLCRFSIWRKALTTEESRDLYYNNGLPKDIQSANLIDMWLLGQEDSLRSIAPGVGIPQGTIIKSSIGNNALEVFGGGNFKISTAPIIYFETKDVKVYNNMYYTSTLPSSDFQYAWIRSALSGATSMDIASSQRLRGYAPASGELVINNLEQGTLGERVPAIEFPTISNIICEFCLDVSQPIITVTVPESDERSEMIKTSDFDLTVLNSDSAAASTDQIWVDDMGSMSWNVTFNSCCPDNSDNQFGITKWKLDESEPAVVYQDTKPSLPTGNYSAMEDGNYGYLKLWAKDCEGRVKTLLIRAHDGYWS